VNICIPIDEDHGLQSPVCAHFSSAPAFMVVDTVSGSCRAILNRNQHPDRGMCLPPGLLHGKSIDGMVVGGIGMASLSKLIAANISVYVSEHATVAETVAAFKAGTLKSMLPEMVCSQQIHRSA
jgi:predicted Fe-Mo cluster-binding NifX family protein